MPRPKTKITGSGCITFRAAPVQRDAVRLFGGSAWLRQQIDLAIRKSGHKALRTDRLLEKAYEGK